DQLFSGVVGQLIDVGHGQRPGRAGLDAQTAEDAAQVVDLVDPAVALARGEPLLVGVVRALDVDRVGRTRPGAQLAADALLQPVRVPVELVPAVEARGELLLLLWVVLGGLLAEHRPEGHPETLDRVEEVKHWGPPPAVAWSPARPPRRSRCYPPCRPRCGWARRPRRRSCRSRSRR